MVSGCLNKQHSTGLCDGRRWSSQWKIRSTKSPVKSTVPRASSIAADGSELWQSCEKWWYSTGLGAERLWCEKIWRVPRSDDFFHHFFWWNHVGRSSSSALIGLMSARNLPKLLSISSNQVFWTLFFHVMYELLQLLQHDYLHPASRLNSLISFPGGEIRISVPRRRWSTSLGAQRLGLASLTWKNRRKSMNYLRNLVQFG